jgi:hypothetical protein
MRHSVLAPTRSAANALTKAITARGWDARVIEARNGVGVIVYAPLSVLNAACDATSFEPGRTVL